jgi:hypothetical protein
MPYNPSLSILASLTSSAQVSGIGTVSEHYVVDAERSECRVPRVNACEAHGIFLFVNPISSCIALETGVKPRSPV